MAVKKNVKIKKQANLEVVKPIKTKPYNDIDLNNWKLYENVKLVLGGNLISGKKAMGILTIIMETIFLK